MLPKVNSRLTISQIGALTIALCFLVSASISAQQTPCEQDGMRRQLDFWVGSWDVFDAQGTQLGSNRIEVLQKGCLLQENWSGSQGSRGQSMNYFDPAEKVWRQAWVSSDGGVVHYTGTFEEGAMRFEGENIAANGQRRLSQVVLEPKSDGTVAHNIQHSTDGGSTWQPYFAGIYRPTGGQRGTTPTRTSGIKKQSRNETPTAKAAQVTKAAATPAATSTTARAVPPQRQATRAGEAPSPGLVQTTTSVRARSKRAQTGDIYEMESPLVLEFALGPLDKLEPGYGWTASEVASYRCAGVEMRYVSAERLKSKKNGPTRIRARVPMRSNRFSAKVVYELEILDGDTVLATAESKRFGVGRSVSEQSREGWVTPEVTFELPTERFDSLYSNGDPQMRLTVTVQ